MSNQEDDGIEFRVPFIAKLECITPEEWLRRTLLAKGKRCAELLEKLARKLKLHKTIFEHARRRTGSNSTSIQMSIEIENCEFLIAEIEEVIGMTFWEGTRDDGTCPRCGLPAGLSELERCLRWFRTLPMEMHPEGTRAKLRELREWLDKPPSEDPWGCVRHKFDELFPDVKGQT